MNRRRKINYYAKRDYNSPEYREFRKEVFSRDNYRCQFPTCKNRGEHAHHLLRYADWKSLRFDPKNALLLCKVHHKLVTRNEEAYAPMFLSIIARKYKIG